MIDIQLGTLEDARKGIPGFYKIDDDDYFALPFLSQSKINDAINSPRGVVYASKSSAYDLGKAFHCYLLEPEEFNERYHVLARPVEPDNRKNIKERKAILAEAELLYPDKIHITPNDYDDILLMMQQTESPFFQFCLDSPYKEIVAIFEYRGHIIKTKLDCFKFLNDEIVHIYDVKTAASTSKWKVIEKAEEFGYHRQAYIYSKAIETLLPSIRDVLFINLFFEKPRGVGNALKTRLCAKDYAFNQPSLELAQDEIDEKLDAWEEFPLTSELFVRI